MNEAHKFQPFRRHGGGENLPGGEREVIFTHCLASLGAVYRRERPALRVGEGFTDVDFQSAHVGSPRIEATSASKSSNSFASVVNA